MNLCMLKHSADQLHQLVMVAQVKSVAIAIRWRIINVIGILVGELEGVNISGDHANSQQEMFNISKRFTECFDIMLPMLDEGGDGENG